jgi:hypothetical protein
MDTLIDRTMLARRYYLDLMGDHSVRLFASVPFFNSVENPFGSSMCTGRPWKDCRYVFHHTNDEWFRHYGPFPIELEVYDDLNRLNMARIITGGDNIANIEIRLATEADLVALKMLLA